MAPPASILLSREEIEALFGDEDEDVMTSMESRMEMDLTSCFQQKPKLEKRPKFRLPIWMRGEWNFSLSAGTSKLEFRWSRCLRLNVNRSSVICKIRTPGTPNLGLRVLKSDLQRRVPKGETWLVCDNAGLGRSLATSPSEPWLRFSSSSSLPIVGCSAAVSASQAVEHPFPSEFQAAHPR